MRISNYTFSHNKNYLYSTPVKGLQGCGVVYRFAFNGQEKDDETYGEGNAYDFGARMYDPRLGKFLSVDPLVNKHPYLSSYLFAGNTPIMAIDLDGLDKFEVVVVPNKNDPKLSQVDVRKVEVCAETVVVYVHNNSEGKEILREAPTSDFKQGSVEEYYMKQQFENTGKTRSEAMNVTIMKDNKAVIVGTPTNKSSTKGYLQGVTLFQYDLNVLFNPDKSAITPKDLQPGTFDKATTDISDFKCTIETPLQYTASSGEKKVAKFSKWKMIVNGETDASPSKYKKGCGNPCLGQDRANSLLNVLVGSHPNNNSTNVINNQGDVKKEDRKASVFITP